MSSITPERVDSSKMTTVWNGTVLTHALNNTHFHPDMIFSESYFHKTKEVVFQRDTYNDGSVEVRYQYDPNKIVTIKSLPDLNETQIVMKDYLDNGRTTETHAMYDEHGKLIEVRTYISEHTATNDKSMLKVSLQESLHAYFSEDTVLPPDKGVTFANIHRGRPSDIKQYPEVPEHVIHIDMTETCGMRFHSIDEELPSNHAVLVYRQEDYEIESIIPLTIPDSLTDDLQNPTISDSWAQNASYFTESTITVFELYD